MPNPSFRINDALYSRMKEAAEARNMTLSDIVRESVAHALDIGEYFRLEDWTIDD
ncbi:hypothetical protein IH992_35265 [Candidatus Poribacteria bacterium]|nr:hypothetical protein [Candidatus Poribacteria bacterium]